jgi:outer membrane protein
MKTLIFFPVRLEKERFFTPGFHGTIFNKIFIFVYLIISTSSAFAQYNDFNTKGEEKLNLQQVIDMALDRSISALKASTVRENRYWQWKTYKSNYRPQLALEGVLPEFNRTISPVTQPDGSILFQPVANNNSILNLSLSQGISATGGEIFVNSQLQRFDDFDRDFTLYNGNPAILGFRQPLFAFNQLAWDRKIEPLRFEESRKIYNEDMEAISYFTTQYYFDLLQGQIDLEIAKKNLANNDTILKISQVKYDLGKISKGELLQLKLALTNSQKSLAQARLSFETALLQLNTYSGIPLHENMIFEIPSYIPDFYIDEDLALSEARKNRQNL